MGRKNRRVPSASPFVRDVGTYYGTRKARGPRFSFCEDYYVREISSARAIKNYLCPGCNQIIPVGIAHYVAWPVDNGDDRRHWHKPCWDRR